MARERRGRRAAGSGAAGGAASAGVLPGALVVALVVALGVVLRPGPWAKGAAVEAAEAAYPEAAGFVNDLAGALQPAARERLEAEVRRLERETGAEVAVAVVAGTAPETPKMYAVKLFERWGVGKRGRDDGVLVLVALAERRVEVEVGYGLEGVLPDAVVGRILDERVVPALRRGDVAGGLEAGVAAIGERIRAAQRDGAGGGRPGQPPARVERAPAAGSPPLPILLLAVGIVLLAGVLARAARRRRCPRCGGRLEERREVLREPTSLLPGEGRLLLACRRCDYRREELYSIPWFPPDLSGPGGAGWPGGAGLPGGRRRWGWFGWRRCGGRRRRHRSGGGRWFRRASVLPHQQ